MGRQTIESGTQVCFSFDAASDQQWGGTRMRVSVNAPSLMRFEGGTTGLPARLAAARAGWRRPATALDPRSHLSCQWRAGERTTRPCSIRPPTLSVTGPEPIPPWS